MNNHILQLALELMRLKKEKYIQCDSTHYSQSIDS